MICCDLGNDAHRRHGQDLLIEREFQGSIAFVIVIVTCAFTKQYGLGRHWAVFHVVMRSLQ